jgi:hypothetical protein
VRVGGEWCTAAAGGGVGVKFSQIAALRLVQVKTALNQSTKRVAVPAARASQTAAHLDHPIMHRAILTSLASGGVCAGVWPAFVGFFVNGFAAGCLPVCKLLRAFKHAVFVIRLTLLGQLISQPFCLRQTEWLFCAAALRLAAPWVSRRSFPAQPGL